MWNRSGNTLSYSAGNVGIGTVAPSQKLEVAGTVKATAFVGDGAGLTDVIISDGSVTSAKLASDAASLNKISGGVMTSSGGNVGIGTTAPGAPLEVRVPGDNAVIRLKSGSAMVPRYSSVDFLDSGNVGWGIGKTPEATFYIDEQGVDNRLTILKGGNVGIGTTTPAAKLQVAGTIMATSLVVNLGTITAGRYVGDGSALTGINLANLPGTLPDARLSANVALRAGGNRFTGGQIVDGDMLIFDGLAVVGPENDGINGAIQIIAGGREMLLDGNARRESVAFFREHDEQAVSEQLDHAAVVLLECLGKRTCQLRHETAGRLVAQPLENACAANQVSEYYGCHDEVAVRCW